MVLAKGHHRKLVKIAQLLAEPEQQLLRGKCVLDGLVDDLVAAVKTVANTLLSPVDSDRIKSDNGEDPDKKQ